MNEKEKLIADIKSLRKELRLSPFPSGYLENKELEELKEIYISYISLKYQRKEHPPSKSKKILLSISGISIILVIIFFILTIMFKPVSLTTSNQENFTISLGFRGNQTVFIIKNFRNKINSFIVSLDEKEVEFQPLTGELPLNANEEIGFVIKNFSCDEKEHIVGIVINNSTKIIRFNNTCL